MQIERLQSALQTLFHEDSHRWPHEGRRIVFWYDKDGQFQDVFTDLELPGVTKLQLANAPFNAKYRLLKLEPTAPFLVYAPHPEPAPAENWLYDIQAYSVVFNADRAAMLMQEFGFLNRSLEGFIREHLPFFAAKKRAESLLGMDLSPDSTERDLRVGLLSALVGLKVADASEAIRRVLMDGLVEDENTLWAEVTKYLEPAEFWAVVAETTGYREAEVNETLRRLFVRLIVTHLERGVHGPFPIALEHHLIAPGAKALAFIDRWFDHATEAERLKARCAEVESDLRLPELLEGLPPDAIFEARSFEALDQALIRACAADLQGQRVDFERWRERLKARQSSPWFSKYHATYRALEAALGLFELMVRFEGSWRASAREMFERYVAETHRVDRAYREFIAASDESGGDILKSLTQRVEAVYVQGFLERLGSAWSDALTRDLGGRWELPRVAPQTLFFEHSVRPILEKNDRARVFVVVSDALRFEVAVALRERLMLELRGEVNLEPILSTLPSVTKFGMAALLPAPVASSIEISGDRVLRGGMPTNTSEARAAVLSAFSGVSAATFAADRVLAWNTLEGREHVAPHRLAYIYHNEIDTIGDKAASERDVMAACARAVDELVKVLKKLVNSLNATNVIVTSDHGFLYQRQELEEADKLEQPKADEAYGVRVLDASQRHVLGAKLEPREGALQFAPPWSSDPSLSVLVPRGSLRFKASGGKQYVHGGASLQEVCVPVLTYRDREGPKAQEGVSRKVGVQITGTARRVTNTRFTINLVQTEAVAGRLRARSVMVVLLDASGKPISDERRAELSNTSPYPTERNVAVRLAIVGNPKSGSSATLIVRDVEDGAELARETWTINLAITDDFGDF